MTTETEPFRLHLPPSDAALPVRMVLDTDTYNEIDDQFALVYAMLSPERVAIEAIYAAPFHNQRSTGPGDGMEKSYDEILRLLALLGRDPEGFAFRGADSFMGSAARPIASDAVTDLIDRARSATPDNPLYVVAIAAITNVSSALLLAPDIADRIVVIWLGGHALHWHTAAEFNLKQDVAAASVLLGSAARIVLLPCMGVVSHLSVSLTEIRHDVAPHGELGRFLAQRFEDYAGQAPATSRVIWDLAAVAALTLPEALLGQPVPTPSLTDDVRWQAEPDRPICHYVYYVTRDMIFADLFARLKAHAGRS